MAPGDNVIPTLHGWAIALAPARIEPVIVATVHWGNAVLEALSGPTKDDGTIAFDTFDMTLLIAHSDEPSPLHEVRGVISAVGSVYAVGDTQYRRLTMTVLTVSYDDGDHDLGFDTSLTDRVWAGE
ncbi:MAG: hypothetical protein ACRCY3_12555 [Sphingorhabdus sp.]